MGRGMERFIAKLIIAMIRGFFSGLSKGKRRK